MMPQGQQMQGQGQEQQMQGQGQEQEPSQVGMIIETVGQGLTALNDGLAQSNAPDEAKQLIAQALESFLGVVEIMGGGGAPGGGQQMPQGQQEQNQQVL